MTEAEKIVEKFGVDVAGLELACEEECIAMDQDWDDEETRYLFEDESIVVIIGNFVVVY